MNKIFLNFFLFITFSWFQTSWGHTLNDSALLDPHPYSLIQDKSETIYFDKDYFYDVTFNSYKLNESHYAMANDMFIISDIVDSMCKTKLFQKLEGEFKEILDAEIPFCDMMTKEEWNADIEITSDGVHGNFPKKCLEENTYPKGNYSTKELVLEAATFTRGLPAGDYKVNVDQYLGEKQILEYDIYFTILKHVQSK